MSKKIRFQLPVIFDFFIGKTTQEIEEEYKEWRFKIVDKGYSFAPPSMDKPIRDGEMLDLEFEQEADTDYVLKFNKFMNMLVEKSKEEEKKKLCDIEKAKKKEAEMKEKILKIKWRVEKFIPAKCPKCLHKFERENEDWNLLKDERRIGEKHYPVIICKQCGNFTSVVMLEAYVLSNKEDAKKLLKDDFVNLQKTLSTAKDYHATYAKVPEADIKEI